MQNQTISISYQFTLPDYIQSNRIYRRNSSGGKVDRIFAIIVLAAAIFSTYGAGFRWWTIPNFLFVPIIWFGLIQQVNIRIALRNNPHLYTDVFEIVIDNDGISAKNNSYEARRKWSAYHSAFESERFFFLAYGKGSSEAAVFPKLAFTKEEQLDLFREFVQKKVGGFSYIK